MSLVSVLIPVKNAADWLDDCLNSLQNQSFGDWECLMLDDGSDDNSREIIYNWTLKDDRIRKVEATGTGLIQANRNLLEAAKGIYVTRMDADDLMPPNRLKSMVELLNCADKNTIVTGKVQFFPETECGPGTQFYEQWLNRRCELNDHWQHIWRECVIPSPCWLMRTEELRSVGGFDSAVYPEDYNMALKLYFAGFQVQAVNEVCHLWRQHSRRYSKNSENYSAEQFMRLKWNYLKKRHTAPDQPICILGTMDKGKLLKKIAENDGFEVVWLAHKSHIAGNIIDGKTILHYRDYPFRPKDCLISTLSSIDDHSPTYRYLQEAGIQVFYFC